MGTLLADRPGVTLCIGFRTNLDGDGLADGHAWVSYAGNNVSDLDHSGNRSARNYFVTSNIDLQRAP